MIGGSALAKARIVVMLAAGMAGCGVPSPKQSYQDSFRRAQDDYQKTDAATQKLGYGQKKKPPPPADGGDGRGPYSGDQTTSSGGGTTGNDGIGGDRWPSGPISEPHGTIDDA